MLRPGESLGSPGSPCHPAGFTGGQAAQRAQRQRAPGQPAAPQHLLTEWGAGHVPAEQAAGALLPAGGLGGRTWLLPGHLHR